MCQYFRQTSHQRGGGNNISQTHRNCISKKLPLYKQKVFREISVKAASNHFLQDGFKVLFIFLNGGYVSSGMKFLFRSRLASVQAQTHRAAVYSAGAAESRLQAQQAAGLHHHDRLQPQLLLRWEDGIGERPKGSPAP